MGLSNIARMHCVDGLCIHPAQNIIIFVEWGLRGAVSCRSSCFSGIGCVIGPQCARCFDIMPRQSMRFKSRLSMRCRVNPLMPILIDSTPVSPLCTNSSSDEMKLESVCILLMCAQEERAVRSMLTASHAVFLIR